ncbi:MAG: GGDEF domain-containing protein [Actinobacteria bacterium]|nr:GGDEF domain-containing protein [Actinomycetota bacterium]
MGLARAPGAAIAAMRRGTGGIRDWQVWALNTPLRAYILINVGLAVTVASVFALRAEWNVHDIAVYLGLLGCGFVAIEATRSVLEARGGVGRDLQTVWYLAIAIVLAHAPAYALLAPVPLTAYRLWRVRRTFAYRRVFSNATISLGYGAAAVAFHAVPTAIAGGHPGTGIHVLTWTAMAACCGALAWLINNGLLAGAMHLADRQTRLRDLFGNAEGMVSDAIELSLAVSLTLVVAINPVLMALALPSVVLYRRYLMTGQLAAQSRIDASTGLLNAGAWRREAEVEVFRAFRARVPLALVMVDVDHFRNVNETVGRAAGDQVLQVIAKTLSDNLRAPGLVGRFGGEEFAIMLPRTHAAEARRIAERLRDHVAAESISIEDGRHAGFMFRLTVSIGIAVLGQSRRALTELINDADTAVSEAKSSGRNRVCVVTGPAGEPGQVAGDRPPGEN